MSIANDFVALSQAIGLPPLNWPPEYDLDDTGLYHQEVSPTGKVGKRRRVSYRLVLITGILTDGDTRDVYLQLAWHDGNNVQKVTIPRNEAMNPRGLAAYSLVGLPTSSPHASLLVMFLAAFEAANLNVIPSGNVAARLGWHGDAFLWGNETIGLGDLTPSPPPGMDSLVRGLRSRGKSADWVEKVLKPVSRFPKVLSGIYATLVPVLLHHIPEAEGFTYEWSGVTSGGKTSSMKVAASVWGHPDGLIGSWNATRVGIEMRMSASGTLPVFLDDTSSLKGDPAVVEQVLYDLTQGIGRTRGAIGGGLRKHGTWRTVLLSSGEQPATDFATRGGARVRSVVVQGYPFGGASRKYGQVVNHLVALALESFGHLGPAFVRLLQSSPSLDLPSSYRRRRKKWASLSNSPYASRIAGHFALMELVGDLIEEMHDYQLGATPEQTLRGIWDEVVRDLIDVEPAVRALRKLRAWMSAHEDEFAGRIPGGAKRLRWAGAWSAGSSWQQVALLPHVLTNILGDENRAKAITREWDAKDWLVREGPGRIKPKVQVGDRRPRCIVVRRGAFIEIGEDEAIEDAPDTEAASDYTTT